MGLFGGDCEGCAAGDAIERVVSCCPSCWERVRMALEAARPPAAGTEDPVLRCVETWNALAAPHDLPTLRVVNGARRKAVAAFLQAAGSEEVAEAAMRAAATVYAAMNGEGKRYGLMSLVRPSRRETWIALGEDEVARKRQTPETDEDQGALDREQRKRLLGDLPWDEAERLRAAWRAQGIAC